MLAGRPISPVNNRRINTLPRDPVPPVTRTRLPSNGREAFAAPAAATGGFDSVDISAPDLLVGCRVLGHLLDHTGPRRRLEARGPREPRSVEAPIADERLVGGDRRPRPVRVIHQR